MMNCQDFKQWLVDQDDADAPLANVAQTHVQQCPACRTLYEKDLYLEDLLKQGMGSVSPPPDLVDRVRYSVESRPERISFWDSLKSWKMAAPVFASLILLLVFAVNPFSSQLQTIDDVVMQGVAFHRDVEMKMDFTRHDMADPGKWFTQNLGYTVQIPDLKRLGLSMVGGRKCRLGKVDAAYLLCKQTGKRVSLFLINPGDIGFKLSDGREYQVKQDGISITVWKEADVVLALVI